VGLLGHVIVRRAGKDYETLVVERICRPLGMNSTRISVPPDLKPRLAAGHAMPGHRTRDSTPRHHDTNAEVPQVLGAGAIRSTANDLLKFVSAYTGLTQTPLSSVIQKATAFHSLESGEKRPLVWEVDGTVFEHGGLVGGYQAELAFDQKSRRGVVMLSNCGNVGTFLPGMWRPFLNGRSPKPAGVVPVDSGIYDSYAGTYRLDNESHTCSVRRLGERLLIQWLGEPGQRVRIPSYEVFPLSESVFRNEFVEIQATFQSASDGQAPKLVFTSLGSVSGFQDPLKLTRITTDISEPPVPVHVDPKIYDGYVGQYRKTLLFGLIRVGPTLNISHAKDELGGHLVARVRGLGAEEIFPTSETSYIPGFDVSDDMRFTFVRNRKGKTTGVIVLLNGKKLRGTRISNRPN
jgi:hypothetical protein